VRFLLVIYAMKRMNRARLEVAGVVLVDSEGSVLPGWSMSVGCMPFTIRGLASMDPL